MQAADAVTFRNCARTPETHTWFVDLVEATRPGLSRYVSKLVPCPDDVQEVVQEAYLKVYCALKNSHGDDHSPQALLYATARNIAISRLRHLQVVARSTTSVGVAEELRREESDTENQVNTRQQFDHLSSAMNSLPPRCRKVILLRLANGLSQKAIGNRLGISVSTVEKHLAKGLRLCSKQLHRNSNGASAVFA